MNLAVLLRHGRRLRTLGIDDGPFVRGGRRQVLVIGAVYAATEFEGLLSTRVRQDGFDATQRLVEMVAGSKFQAQLHMIFLDGLTLGGFNVVDLPRLADGVGIPCAAVVRRRPDLAAVAAALQHLPRVAVRQELFRRAGPFYRVGSLHFQVAGVEPQLAGQVISRAAIHGVMPESLRAAHLIARGIVTGESGRRA